MKHLKLISAPAKAQLPEGHPNIFESIKGFLENPAAVIDLHLNKNNNGEA